MCVYIGDVVDVVECVFLSLGVYGCMVICVVGVLDVVLSV